jgi:hypothetical protein
MGKVLSIIIMIGGVSLFIRLVQVTMRGARFVFLARNAGCCATILMRSTAKPAALASESRTTMIEQFQAIKVHLQPVGFPASPDQGTPACRWAAPCRHGA